MYSPKIREEYIPVLYRLAKSRKLRMTAIANEAIAKYIENEVNNGWINVVPEKTMKR
jgi:post-segregation antitoxin (ccd killing protein)